MYYVNQKMTGKSKSRLFANVEVTQSEHNSESLFYTELPPKPMLQTIPLVTTIKHRFASITLHKPLEGLCH